MVNSSFNLAILHICPLFFYRPLLHLLCEGKQSESCRERRTLPVTTKHSLLLSLLSFVWNWVRFLSILRIMTTLMWSQKHTINSSLLVTALKTPFEQNNWKCANACLSGVFVSSVMSSMVFAMFAHWSLCIMTEYKQLVISTQRLCEHIDHVEKVLMCCHIFNLPISIEDSQGQPPTLTGT